jgi:hypothetical protein
VVIAVLESSQVTNAHIEDGALEIALEFIRWLANNVLEAHSLRYELYE